MVITVTMNPAVDKSAEIETYNVDGLNVLKNVSTDVGGKGINVSRTLRVLNRPNIACGLVGGMSGQVIRNGLKKQMIMTDFVPIQGESRTNLKINTAFGMAEFNEPGPKVHPEEVEELIDHLKAHAKPGNFFVLSGSLPEGVTSDVYQRIIQMCHGAGCKVFLDTSGEALKQGLKAEPDYVKPNLQELLELYEHDGSFDSKEEMIDWVKQKSLELWSRGAKLVTVSLGADGAVFADGLEAMYVPAKDVNVSSTVGAGDAMTAAIAYGVESNMHFRDIIRYAMAVSGAACATKGTNPPERNEIVKLLRQA